MVYHPTHSAPKQFRSKQEVKILSTAMARLLAGLLLTSLALSACAAPRRLMEGFDGECSDLC
jgi:hypothetical protein